MSAPLSIGELDGCVVACPLHSGRFDLATGEPVQMPTTGGLWPDGRYEPVWSPPGREPKEDPPGIKAEARRLTRVRRFRYYPVRVVGRRHRGRRPGLSDPAPGAGVRRGRADPVLAGERGDDRDDLDRVVGHPEQVDVGLADRPRRELRCRASRR